MSKSELILDVVTNMRTLADSIRAVCDAMAQNEPDASNSKAPIDEPKQQKAEKVLTIEEVRPILGQLSHAGYTAQIHQLIQKYGAIRLGEVDPKNYAALLKDAEELDNATK